MGFFDQMRDAFKGLVDDIDAELGRITNTGTLSRVCQAAFLMGRADGDFDASEKSMLQQIVAKKLPYFKAADILKAINDAEGELAFTVEGGTQMLLANIAKASGTDQAQLIMLAALAVANADGNFDDDEKKVARTIANRLGLNASDYGL